MAYSSAALSLRKPAVIDLPRSGDRISYLHLDRCRIEQDRTGVVALMDDGTKFRPPVANLSLLMLGPGTSITTPAMSTLHRAGATVMTTSDGGLVGISAAKPLTSRSKWAEAQARMWADESARQQAARTLYRHRYPSLDWPDDMPLRVMRGVEGSQVKKHYRTLSKRHGLQPWKRDPTSTDHVNVLLNMLNAMLYGTALASATALGLSPALGIIHNGSIGALLFDLADGHKAQSSIPIAFEQHNAQNPEAAARKKMRTYLRRANAMTTNLELLDEVLSPHLPGQTSDRLTDDDGAVPGHRNYA